MRKLTYVLVSLAVLLPWAIGCDRSVEPGNGHDASFDQDIAELRAAAKHYEVPVIPAPLVTVEAGSESKTFWPFTGDDFSGEGCDPINLIFIGRADPRQIRAALLSLDGDRSDFGMPPIPPLNCRWDDAIGDVQTGYGEPDDWTAGCIQLECGDHLQARFHLRLFNLGDWNVANCHFEVLIPGTSEHQVLSWELAELLVKIDLIRSGLLDPDFPLMTTDQINTWPDYRTIPAMVYNRLPVPLRQLIGGPENDVKEDVPIATDGCATLLNLAGSVNWQAETRTQDFYINFGQMVPKPFCSSGPGDFVYVEGPVHLYQTSEIDAEGNYRVNFNAQGQLSVTPVNPLTGEATGGALAASVIEHHTSAYSDHKYSASSMQYQKILPSSASESGRLFTLLRADSRDKNLYYANVQCNFGVDEMARKPRSTLFSGGSSSFDE